MDPLDLLRSVAGDFRAKEIGSEQGRWHCEVDVPLPSHESVVYRLVLWRSGDAQVGVKELPGGRLPSCCPERHINQGGSFCMYWVVGEPLNVTDENGAREWWALLLAFLMRQEAAAKLRKWIGSAYAHGEAAAYQAEAELMAARLGTDFVAKLSEGVLSVRSKQNHGKNRIELMDHDKVVARLQLTSKALTNTKMPCICTIVGKPRPIGECGTHAEDLSRFIIALGRWRKGEERYFRGLRRNGARCCRTLESCPLKQ